MRLAESFLSINGEGLYVGYLAQFIRLSGCVLSCSYCDTAWAQNSGVGDESSVAEILQLLKASPAKHVTLTGGEPLAAHGVMTLIKAILEETEMELEIETSGAVDLEPFLRAFAHEPNLHFTVDYKLPSSLMTDKMIKSHYALLRKGDVVKYVMGTEEDLNCALSHLKTWKNEATPIFSPIYGKIEASRLVEAVKDHELSEVRVQLQLHKYIWDPNLQGV